VRIVFDTNVYISAVAFAGGKSALAFGLASSGAFELVTSEEIVAELVGKLGEPKFGFSEAQLQDAERELREIATLVRPTTRLSVLEDEPDNRILECAVEAGASAIVTGDKDLLALKSYESIGIMTVAELLYTFPALPGKPDGD
jgi:putative PIN family toxin of toxin-antitoxin system